LPADDGPELEVQRTSDKKPIAFLS
jgi:hypothetical protein